MKKQVTWFLQKFLALQYPNAKSAKWLKYQTKNSKAYKWSQRGEKYRSEWIKGQVKTWLKILSNK
jgi:hypothetical protein